MGANGYMKFLTKDIYGFLPFKKVEIIEKIDARVQTTLILNCNLIRAILFGREV